MQKPDDIPQDIWETARSTIETNNVFGPWKSPIEAVARAILDERKFWSRAWRVVQPVPKEVLLVGDPPAGSQPLHK